MKNIIFKLLIILTLITPSFYIYAEDEPPVLPPDVHKENILIRNGDTVVYDGSIDLPAEGTLDVLDNTGISHSVNTRSVLGVLYALDQASDSFSLSNLQYYDSLSSFYLKCITSTSELCDNWQYVVGGVGPWTSIDSTILSGGETVGFYFGSPYRVNLSSNTVTVSDTITATSESYNYLDNTWNPRTGVTIGITKPNPNDQWSPIVVSTYPVDTNGQAILTFTSAGSYTVGVSEDYYFPSYNITVNEVSSGGGGGGGGVSTPTFSTINALDFLVSHQNQNGSFGDMLYTDWSAIAFASVTNQANDAKQKVADYLKNNSLSSSVVTDNERHAMALMALGINPYSDTSTNYISKITSSFDGTQFGDSSLINDDIFALLVLKNAGYTLSDDIINKDVSYLISNQSPDGSWVGVDMTAAAIGALRNFIDLPGVPSSITQAENYLISIQGGDGGFGNSFSTSWALQALSQNPTFTSQTSKADTYLASHQQSDGGLESMTDPVDSRVWSTSYAVASISHKSWNSIMQSFNKQLSPKDTSNTTSVTNVTPVSDKIITTQEIIEPKIEEAKLLEKDTKPKVKAKINKHERSAVASAEQDKTTNPLIASVADASTEHSLPFSVIDSIISIILAPFVWLFVHLGF